MVYLFVLTRHRPPFPHQCRDFDQRVLRGEQPLIRCIPHFIWPCPSEAGPSPFPTSNEEWSAITSHLVYGSTVYLSVAISYFLTNHQSLFSLLAFLNLAERPSKVFRCACLFHCLSFLYLIKFQLVRDAVYVPFEPRCKNAA